MIEKDRLISADSSDLGQKFDRALRPKKLKDYIGQSSVKRANGNFYSNSFGKERCS